MDEDTLPQEVLDRIISNVIYSPNHAGLPIAPKESYRALFRPQALHVNRQLRSCALAFIARDVFWIKIRCDTCRVKEHIERFGIDPPRLPAIWSSLLPCDISALMFSFNKANLGQLGHGQSSSQLEPNKSSVPAKQRQ